MSSSYHDVPLELSIRLPGRRAFVTGAASGFGRAFALRLARDGWRVAMLDRDAPGVERAARDVADSGGFPEPFAVDVRDDDDFADAAEAFLKRAGGVDLLINNAGIGAGGLVGDFSLADWQELLNVNVMGVVRGCHVLLPAMKRAQSGRVLNVSSAAAFVAGPEMGAYNVAKAAVLTLSETLHAELAPWGIGVSCLLAAFVKTDLHRRLLGPDESRKHAEKLITGARYEPDEVAEHTLARAGEGKFYIFFPPALERLWDFKRKNPERFFREAADFYSRDLAERSSPAASPPA